MVKVKADWKYMNEVLGLPSGMLETACVGFPMQHPQGQPL